MSKTDSAAVIRTVSDLARFVEGKKDLIFRGQADLSWHLVPSILRNGFLNTNKPNEIILSEENMLGLFKRQARPHINPVPNENNHWEWLALAQHYGLPTCLLDWTEQAAAALFFAVENPNGNKSSAVWVSERPKPATKSEDYPFHISRICLFEPPHISPRITVQQACFTAHPTDYLLKRYEWPGRLDKLVIPVESRVIIRNELRSLGVHRASLFPELEGIAMEIRNRFSTKEDEL
jgi:hypothetical protein